ncbi:hypothetical protein [Streptomyces californicus]
MLAPDTGLSDEELSRAVTRPAFHAGCPNALGAAGQLRAILADAEQPRAPGPALNRPRTAEPS